VRFIAAIWLSVYLSQQCKIGAQSLSGVIASTQQQNHIGFLQCNLDVIALTQHSKIVFHAIAVVITSNKHSKIAEHLGNAI
jgi:hypothetical protein